MEVKVKAKISLYSDVFAVKSKDRNADKQGVVCYENSDGFFDLLPGDWVLEKWTPGRHMGGK